MAHDFLVGLSVFRCRVNIHFQAAVFQHIKKLCCARVGPRTNRESDHSFRIQPLTMGFDHESSILAAMNARGTPELNPPPHTYAVRVGVATLVFNEEGFLLLHKRKGRHEGGTWSVPGGHIDFGETPEEACIREAKEEVDIEIADVRFQGYTNDVFDHSGRHYITLWYRAEWTGGEPRIAAPDEVEEIGWFPLDAIPSPLFLPLEQMLQGHITRSAA